MFGTTFMPMPTMPSHSPEPSTPGSVRLGVLVVDDEPIVLHLLQSVLDAEGIPVWLANGGTEALKTYQRNRPHIGAALLDVRMPEMDGPQLLAELHKLAPDLPCCFMTGHSGDYEADNLLAIGAVAVFEKPFRWPELLPVVRSLVASDS